MYCRKCGKQIDDDSKFCEHCGYNFMNNTQKYKRKRKVKKTVITIVIIAILLIVVWFAYNLLFNNGSSDVFIISRNDGSRYLVDLSNLDNYIVQLKEKWTIDNQIGIIDTLEDKATRVFILKSKNIESNKDDSKNYYYASCIDLNNGSIEDLEIQIPKSYGLEEAFNQVAMEVYRTGKGASVCLWNMKDQ